MNSSYLIRPESTPTTYREQIVNMVQARRKASERASALHRRNWPRYYDLWRGVIDGSHTVTKNNIHIPLIFSVIQSDVARKMATAYSSWPYLTFSGYGPDDASYARRVEALINAQLRDAQVIPKEYHTFLAGDLYGTAVSQVMWDHQETYQTIDQFQSLPLSGEVVRDMQRMRVTQFDGPNYRNVDLLDFFPQPGYKFINGNQGMQWCIVRYYLDLDQCRFLASDLGGKIFDPEEVELLAKNSSGGRTFTDEGRQRRFDSRLGLAPSPSLDMYSRPVEIVEMWGSIPYELAAPFGDPEVVISLANDEFVLRARSTPLHHKQKPFLKYSPTPDPHYFHAPGKGELSHQLQIAANRYMNHQLDAGDLLVHPMMIVNRNANIIKRNLWARPGAVFDADGPPSQTVAPFPLDMRPMQAAMQQVQSVWGFVQMGTGIQDDTIMGMGNQNRDVTAREFVGRRESAGTRLMLESILYDADYIEPLGDMFSAMNDQFLTFPRSVLILGESARTDPVTGDPVPQMTRENIDGSELGRGYSAHAAGTTMSLSRETQKANDLQMLQILASGNPAFTGSFNQVNFLRQVMRNLGYKNVNELIQKMPSVAESLSAQGVQGGAAGVPETGGGAIGQFLGGGAPSGPTSGIAGMT